MNGITLKVTVNNWICCKEFDVIDVELAMNPRLKVTIWPTLVLELT